MPNKAALTNLDAARAYFRRVRIAQVELCERSYILHLPSSDTSWVGVGAHRLVHFSRQGFEMFSNGEKVFLPASGDIFRDLSKLLDPDLPCFFLVSLDIARSACDPALPLMSFMQPEAEICFSGRLETQQPAIHAASQTAAALARQCLQEAAGLPLQPVGTSYSSASAGDWTGEDDANFLERLERAVDKLQTVHGKMIITRTYRKQVAENADLFRLFEIYAGIESNAAACHFAKLGRGTSSVGCSPENIFEMHDRQLFFDVVASTRGISANPEEDARWLAELKSDPKERNEHIMALERYQKRMQRLCSPDSIKLDHHMDVRTLKHVRHLYSRVSGLMIENLDFFDLLHDSFPPLSSYPEELIPLSDPDKEPTRYYGGMIGRVGAGWRDASCFLNLRAALLQDRILHTQGGVGVIRNSIPRLELLEVANKLRGLKEAVAIWEFEEGQLDS